MPHLGNILEYNDIEPSGTKHKENANVFHALIQKTALKTTMVWKPHANAFDAHIQKTTKNTMCWSPTPMFLMLPCRKQCKTLRFWCPHYRKWWTHLCFWWSHAEILVKYKQINRRPLPNRRLPLPDPLGPKARAKAKREPCVPTLTGNKKKHQKTTKTNPKPHLFVCRISARATAMGGVGGGRRRLLSWAWGTSHAPWTIHEQMIFNQQIISNGVHHAKYLVKYDGMHHADGTKNRCVWLRNLFYFWSVWQPTTIKDHSEMTGKSSDHFLHLSWGAIGWRMNQLIYKCLNSWINKFIH